MSNKITFQNIKNFVEGTGRQVGAELGMTPKHIMEQAAWRETKCPDCKKAGKCSVCRCSVPGRWFTTQTCNATRFPDMMGPNDWAIYKKDNGISVEWKDS